LSYHVINYIKSLNQLTALVARDMFSFEDNFENLAQIRKTKQKQKQRNEINCIWQLEIKQLWE